MQATCCPARRNEGPFVPARWARALTREVVLPDPAPATITNPRGGILSRHALTSMSAGVSGLPILRVTSSSPVDLSAGPAPDFAVLLLPLPCPRRSLEERPFPQAKSNLGRYRLGQSRTLVLAQVAQEQSLFS